MTEQKLSGDLVREVVARADRRRRVRRALETVVHVAPWAAGVALLAAVAARLAGLAPMATVGVILLLAAGVAAGFVMLRGAQGKPDVVAARVDADASLAGELRSASWFADHPDGEMWTGYHLDRAAEHAQRVDWDSLYPPVRAARAWALTGVGVAAALLLAATTPAPPALGAAQGGESLEALAGDLLDELPPDLRRQLEELLERMGEGGEAGDMAQASLAELQELMKDVDPELAAKLAELAKQAAEAGEIAEGGEKPPDAMAADAKNANAGLPEDVRWAVDDLAERLANASRDRQTNAENPAASEETAETGAGSDQAATEAGSDMQMKLSREAASDPGAGKMMMAGAGAMGAMGGDSRQGAGGNNGARDGNQPDPLSIAQALRQETVEASQDTQGQNVEKEDIRRKTEQGEATVGFTRTAPPSTVDRSRAQAPPVVPDARRTLLLNYFIRQK